MTQAILLSAGRGERLRPITDTVPKPLLEIGTETLLGRHLSLLASAGVSRVVINLGWLGARIAEYVGDGSRWGVEVTYSAEGYPTLDTGGAIAKALPLLNDAPFWVVNADIWTDFRFGDPAERLGKTLDACIGLVDNPAYRDSGDFAIVDGLASNDGARAMTFSGIACYRPWFFSSLPVARGSVVPLLRSAADAGALGAFRLESNWFDAGTPERVAQLTAFVANAIE